MKQLILPLALALAGAAGGLGAGLMLRPVAESADEAAGKTAHTSSEPATDRAAAPAQTAASARPAHGDAPEAGTGSDFVKLNNQFVVPVLHDGRVTAMVVLSLTIEAPLGAREQIYAIEPRIRDSFLQVMFDYANAGGFDGTFTQAQNLDDLRTALRESARALLGVAALDVLVTDIARQDI